ncbi:MAG: glycoside hydrolase family 127 protein [Phycisphaerae bacterium]|nr:glycoside hydrolase family 127 protein [Phycisphaerae bacterium]
MTAQRRLTPAAFEDVQFDGGVLGTRRETNRTVSLMDQYTKCKSSGRIDALDLTKKGIPRHRFWDSDVAKWVEAASYSLSTHPDKRLAAKVNEVADLFVAAQQPDGYINSYFTAEEPENRWTNLAGMHELYQAGHMMEAAVAHQKATGRREFLDAVRKFADYIGTVFGRGKGRKRGYPGHQEIELALVKLYRVTGEKRYLTLSKYFVDERGRKPFYFYEEAAKREKEDHYNRENMGLQDYAILQADRPVREMSDARGHAVRALYLYSAMADLAGETDDAELLGACRRLWESVTKRQMYLTGGVGQQRVFEGFDVDFSLANDTAYAETCAAISLIFFAHRMLQIDPRGEYADVMERALYNGVLSGVSLDGEKYFYANPLAVRAGVNMAAHHADTGKLYERAAWFGCACCPSNLGRLLASLGQYVYSTEPKAAWVHLYAAGSGKLDLAGKAVTLRQKTHYPWDEKIRITVNVDAPTNFALHLRIPGWCRKHNLKVNGRGIQAAVTKGYAAVQRAWRDGDVLELTLSMPIERIVAHPQVASDGGKVALQRGPIVYCLEQCDHNANVHGILLPDSAKLTARYEKDLLGGCVTISGKGVAPVTAEWKQALYHRADEASLKPTNIKAVPYALWCNRTPGYMTVWISRIPGK